MRARGAPSVRLQQPRAGARGVGCRPPGWGDAGRGHLSAWLEKCAFPRVSLCVCLCHGLGGFLRASAWGPRDCSGPGLGAGTTRTSLGRPQWPFPSLGDCIRARVAVYVHAACHSAELFTWKHLSTRVCPGVWRALVSEVSALSACRCSGELCSFCQSGSDAVIVGLHALCVSGCLGCWRALFIATACRLGRCWVWGVLLLCVSG